MDNLNFKIAFVTNDGISISSHFGPSKLYTVIEVKDGQMINSKIINKPNFHAAGQQHNHGQQHQHSHSGDCGGGNSQEKHTAMLDVIKDCDYLAVGGMGYGMFNHLETAGIKPILTDENDINTALSKMIKGELISRQELVH